MKRMAWHGMVCNDGMAMAYMEHGMAYTCVAFLCNDVSGHVETMVHLSCGIHSLIRSKQVLN